MTRQADATEVQRLQRQAGLDRMKTQAERNRLGQFATPPALARHIVEYGLDRLGSALPVRFLDPAFGTGAFYSALRAATASRGQRLLSAHGFEIDPHYAELAKTLWAATPLQLRLADFTRLSPPRRDEEKPNLLICNPPYVRHHHLASEEKIRLQALALECARVRLSGLAGFYCHFMALAHAWLADDGIAGWLIPSEFMDVNYGRALKTYLQREVSLLHIHRFDPSDVQFDDALVSSAVVWFRKAVPAAALHARFSFGGALASPTCQRLVAVAGLDAAEKWSAMPFDATPPDNNALRLGDLFSIKRGLATGDNRFFIIDEDRVRALNLPERFLRPVLPSSRYLVNDTVDADERGLPRLAKRLFLIDCDVAEEPLRRDYPTLWQYLEDGRERVASGYICRHRKLWYAQENRPAAPIVCTYMGRGKADERPFRFILNASRAVATNVYLMLYPRPLLAQSLREKPERLTDIWRALNAIPARTLLGHGRVYGGGLYKLEPRELAGLPADALAQIAGLTPRPGSTQSTLF